MSARMPSFQPPTPVPLLRRPIAWLCLQAQLIALALISAVFNIGAFLLYPLLPRAAGRRLGRAAIANGYRGYWHFTRPFGQLRLHAELYRDGANAGGCGRIELQKTGCGCRIFI